MTKRMPLTEDDPRHGSCAGYVAHVKAGIPVCMPCLLARREYNARTSKERGLGITRRLPQGNREAALLRKHIARLKAAGMTNASIAAVAGVAESTVARAAKPEHAGARLMRRTVRAIAAVQVPLPTEAAEPGLLNRSSVPKWRVERRLQALVALGYTHGDLGQRLRMSSTNFSTLLNGTRKAQPEYHAPRTSVRLETFERVDKVFRELQMVPGPSEKHRALARSRGWHPPLMWDDIDDPNEVPVVIDEKPLTRLGNPSVTEYDEAAVVRALMGKPPEFMTHADRLEIVRRALEKGLTYNFLIRRAGVTKPDRFTRELRAAGWDWQPPEPQHLYLSEGQVARLHNHHKETA